MNDDHRTIHERNAHLHPTPSLRLHASGFPLRRLHGDTSAALGGPTRRLLDSPGCDAFPDTKCDIGCCAAHDICFDVKKCTAASWAATICQSLAVGTVVSLGTVIATGGAGAIPLIVTCTVALATTSQECIECNNRVAACITKACSGRGDEQGGDKCYNNRCDKSFSCPGECTLFDPSDEACCGCSTGKCSCYTNGGCGDGECCDHNGEDDDGVM